MVGFRLHIVPYVSPEQVCEYLSTADIALIPFHPAFNHEISLPSKFGEYLGAQLPILASDLGEYAEAIKSHKLGVVFKPNDARSFIEAFNMIKSDLAYYRMNAGNFFSANSYSLTWQKSEDTLIELYSN